MKRRPPHKNILRLIVLITLACLVLLFFLKTMFVIFLEVTDKNWIFEGVHRGYYPIIVKRRIEYNVKTKEFKITDTTTKEANLKLNLHLNPNLKITTKDNKIKLNKLEIQPENYKINQGIYSEGYGHTDKTNVISIEKKGTELITLFKIN